MNPEFTTYDKIKDLVSEDLKKMSLEIFRMFENSVIPNSEFLNELETCFNNGSKQIRSCLIFLFSRALFGKVCNETIKLAAAIEIIHNATLIHDDIIDEAPMRRGKTALHKKCGNKLAIISGDFLLSLAMRILSELGNIAIINNFALCLNSLCIGEIEQYFSQKTTPTINQYLQKSSAKTASLFQAGLKSLSCINNNEFAEILDNFAIRFGTAFQISDDLKNFPDSKEQFLKNPPKPLLNDIENGIYTAPVIYTFGENKNLSNISTEKIIKSASNIEARKKTLQLIQQEKESATSQITSLPDSTFKQAILDLCKII